jgi:HEAT repeat protein
VILDSLRGIDTLQEARASRFRWWHWVIAAMVLVWVVAFLARNNIRAYWWADRLAASDSLDARWMYVCRLQSLGDKAVPAVSGILQDDSPEIRRMAVTALHHAPGREARDLLRRACADPDEEVRRAAFSGLATRRDEHTLAEIAAMVPDERTAMIATYCLRGIATHEAREAIIDLLKSSPHAGVRIEAIDALAALQVRAAVEPLIDALDDSDVFEGMTEGDIRASQVYEGARASFIREWLFPVDATLALPDRRVVREAAAHALSVITGHSLEDDDKLSSDGSELQQAWRTWWEEEADKNESAP